MLPIRYKNSYHALRLILIEEGILGLYRGFIFFNIFMYIHFYSLLHVRHQMF